MAAKSRNRRGAKSQAIRAYLAQHPDAPAADVVSALKGQGIKVTPAFVYTLRSKSMRKPRKARRKRITAVSGKGASRALARDRLTADQLLATKALADRLGGIASLRAALDILERLR
jgi:hypothetical protein